jgi:hypothetical protein
VNVSLRIQLLARARRRRLALKAGKAAQRIGPSLGALGCSQSDLACERGRKTAAYTIAAAPTLVTVDEAWHIVLVLSFVALSRIAYQLFSTRLSHQFQARRPSLGIALKRCLLLLVRAAGVLGHLRQILPRAVLPSCVSSPPGTKTRWRLWIR